MFELKVSQQLFDIIFRRWILSHLSKTFQHSLITIQRIWIVLGRCLFYDSKRSIGEVLFFNQFYWSDFWSGKWKAWNNLEWFWRWIKVKSGAKREWFLFILLFLREREIDVWKNFLQESEIFLITYDILKKFFSFIMAKRFGYDFGLFIIVLILGWFR